MLRLSVAPGRYQYARRRPSTSAMGSGENTLSPAAVGMNRGALMSTSRPKGLTSQKLRAIACPTGCLMVIQTLPTKPAVCTNYCIVSGAGREHAENMLESTASFPAIFFAAIIGVIVFLALSELMLDPHE